MPQNWHRTTLADIATVQGGGTPSRSEPSYFGGDLPWVTPSDLAPIGEVTLLGQVAESLTLQGLRASSAKLLPPGSVLFSSRASIGKIAVTDRECATNQGFINLTPKGENVDPWFLAYLLARHRGDLIQLAGKTTFLEIPRGKIKDYEVAIPPLLEQRRIVSRIKACLERVEEIKRLRSGAVQESAAITPSLLNEVFVSVAGSAPSKSIGEVALETRYGTSNKCHTEPSGVPILRIPNVAAGSVNFDDLKFCELDGDELRRVQLVTGDLLFVRTNGSRDLVGRCAVFEPRRAEEQVGFASYLIRARLDPQQVLPRYLAYFLNSTQGREEINQRRRTSAGQFNINSENLRSISLPVPPVQEQARLIALMEERGQIARQLTDEIRTAGAEGAQLRESVLRRAFAGEL